MTFLQVAMGYILGRIFIAYTLLPRYFDGKLVTAYALLEERFGPETRRVASVTFMVTRAFGDSVRVFATAIPIALILKGVMSSGAVQPAAILILGLFTVLYTYHGGMRAVIWTDVVQTAVYLIGGLAAVWLIGHGTEGGWSVILSQAHVSGKLRFLDFSLGLDNPNTLFAGLLGGAFLSMASHGVDQLLVQRLLAAGGLREARMALIGSGFAVLGQFVLFLLIGTGLYSFYHGQAFGSPDAIFPKFIIEVMPSGMTGLVIAAILAAAMSTVSSALNSLSAATVHDLYIPLRRKGAKLGDREELRLGKIFTLLWAAVLVGGALAYRQQGTPVVMIALSIASFTYGGLLGAFYLGILWKRADQRDAIIGMGTGIAVMTVVVFAQPLIRAFPALSSALGPVAHLAWPWYVLCGTLLTWITGALSSLTHSAVPSIATSKVRALES
jgi:SSS family transporter